MKKLLLMILTCVVAGSAFGQAPAKHVVLISMDGLRPDFYLEEKWPAPYLKEMAQQGAHAQGVRGVFPSVTYPSHTTLITGALPARHGIYYNSPFEPAGQTGRWYWEESLIQTRTLWDAVQEAGMKSASFFWPVSVGAPVDYNVPEVWALGGSFESLDAVRKHETPSGFMAELEVEVTGKLTTTTFHGDYLNREDRTGEMAAYTLEKYKPNLITVHLIATDHFQHEEGREGPKVQKALAAADRALGKLVEAAQRAGILDETTFIITGDHGFVDIHAAFQPNYFLVEAGMMAPQEDRGKWKASWHTSGAAAFLHLKDPKDLKTLQGVRELFQNLPSPYRKLFRMVEAEELREIGADPHVALALAPVQGIAMGSGYEVPLKKASGGTHGFFPDIPEIQTGFVAWGAGIKGGVVVPLMGLEDVAPVVSYLLGLNFEALDGVRYDGLFKGATPLK